MTQYKNSVSQSPLTAALHADDYDETHLGALSVAPDISVTTTFRAPPPADLVALKGIQSLLPSPKQDDKIYYDHNGRVNHVYSRYSQPTVTRVEKVLSALLKGEALTYSSGIGAAMGALLLVQPDVIAIREGYHGCHEVIRVYSRIRGADKNGDALVRVIDLDDAYPRHDANKRLLCWLETPINPTGECRDIAAYAKKISISSPGSILLVDSTFAPPPLSDPFAFGADLVLHSGTKFLAGHSDALIGVLATKKGDLQTWRKLWYNRTYAGTSPGSLETWLLLRSLKTLHMRVIAQSDTSTRLATWLKSLTGQDYRSDAGYEKRIIRAVWHTSFQDAGKWVGFDAEKGVSRQMRGGGAPCFSMLMEKEIYAKWLPHLTKIFTPATSLGSVESLIEHKLVTDPNADPRLVRLSVGVEDFVDLKYDLLQAFNEMLRLEHKSKNKL